MNNNLKSLQIFYDKLRKYSDLTIIEKHDFYIIYFYDKRLYYKRLEKIDKTFNKLVDKYQKYLKKDILYGCFHEYYDNEDEIKLENYNKRLF